MKSSVIYGIHPILEALKSGVQVEKVFIQQQLNAPMLRELRQACKDKSVSVSEVPFSKIKQLASGKNHQGVIAWISPVSYYSMEEVIISVFENGEQPFFLVLDGVTDVRNFGAICRTAECMGVHAVVIPLKGSAPITEDAVKTSAGALMRIKVCKMPTIKKAVEMLELSGIQTIAATEKGNKSIYDAGLSGPIAIVLGSEESGISQEVLKKASQLVNIPMQNQIASLNVSVAGGIMMSEVLRTRLKNP